MSEPVLLRGTIDKDSIDEIIKLLLARNIKEIKGNRNIISHDRRKFEKYLDYQIVYSDNKDNIYKFVAKKDNTYVLFLINAYRHHINPELEVFTYDLEKAIFYKKDNIMRNLRLELTTAENTPEVLEGFKYNDSDIKKYTQEETKIKAQKKVTIDKINKELSELYKNRISSIEKNKNLYKDLKSHSKEFYTVSEAEKTKEQIDEYKEYYKNILGQIDENKKTVLELNAAIEILEKKKALYISEVFIFSPFSGLEIKSITSEEGKKYEELDKSKPEAPAKKKIIPKPTSIVKKGGELYDLEYLEIPETFSRSVESNFGKIKKEIKKQSKKTSKNELLSKYTF